MYHCWTKIVFFLKTYPNIKLDPVLAQDVTPEIPTNVVTIELIKERWKARFSVASFQNELDHSAAHDIFFFSLLASSS